MKVEASATLLITYKLPCLYSINLITKIITFYYLVKGKLTGSPNTQSFNQAIIISSGVFLILLLASIINMRKQESPLFFGKDYNML